MIYLVYSMCSIDKGGVYMDIRIPFNDYTLNIDGLNLGVVEKTISKNGLSVTAEIAWASISGTPTTYGKHISFNIFLEDNNAYIHRDKPIMSGSMKSYAYSDMPGYYFEGVTSKKETTNFNWSDINLPFATLYIEIFDGLYFHTKTITMPYLSVSDITYDIARVKIHDTSQTHAYALYKENGNGVREREAGQQNISTLPFTNLEMGTDYVLWLDSANGLLNFLRFSTLGAPVWAKTDNGFQKGKLWVKTSEGWKKAKGIFGRKSVSDSWVKGK